MKLRKVSMSDRDILRKYRTQNNCEVSYWRDEFDCDGYTAQITYSTDRQKQKPNFGVCKHEWLVSNANYTNGFRGRVNG